MEVIHDRWLVPRKRLEVELVEAMSLVALMADAWPSGGRGGRRTGSVACCMAPSDAYMSVQQSWDTSTGR